MSIGRGTHAAWAASRLPSESPGSPVVSNHVGSARQRASIGLALVLFVLGAFALSAPIVSGRRALDVTKAKAIVEAYHDAQLSVAWCESLERKYRLEPSAKVRSDFSTAFAGLRSALVEVVRSGDDVSSYHARYALAKTLPYADAMDTLFRQIDNGAGTAISEDHELVHPIFDDLEAHVNEGAKVQDARLTTAVSRLQTTATVFMIVTPLVFVVGAVLLAFFTLSIRRFRRRIDHQAIHDTLTGLPNRAFFYERTALAVAASPRTGSRTAVLLIDLDRFKEINDTLGHHSGDQVLVALARRLIGFFGDGAVVARLGGDEFAVLLTNIASADAAAGVAEKLLAEVRAPIVIGGLSFDIDASIGICVAPDQADTVEQLIQHADVAMYVAKSSNAGWNIYAPESDRNSPERLAVLGDLRRGIANNELVLYYQPKIELPSGRVRGVEALVRWNHPTRGLVPPDEFIPLAEKTSLIEPLTTWVVRESMTQARRWFDEGLGLSVAINISARSLISLEFVAHVETILKETAAPAGLIELEVTESAIMVDPVKARVVLERFHQLGLKLSIDDFGTGFTSLAYLRALPINVLKVDRLFIRDMLTEDADRVIVRSVIELGRNLGLGVVAEGVEDEATARELSSMGCSLGQGYLWSRPLPVVEFNNWHSRHDAALNAEAALLTGPEPTTRSTSSF